MKLVALIVAGGKGVRMESSIPKQFLLLNKMPILMHTIKCFAHLQKIVLVLPSNEISNWETLCQEYDFTLPHTIVEGGESRFHSVKNGLKEVPKDCIVAIHDGVRPFVSPSLLKRLIENTKADNGIIPVIPIKDSIRRIENDHSTPIDRKNLFKIQTPQCFISANIKHAYNQQYAENFTDDASVFESFGGNIITVLGEEKNIKITTQEDLLLAELFIK